MRAKARHIFRDSSHTSMLKLTARNFNLKNKLFLVGAIILVIAVLSVAFTLVATKNLNGAAAAINEAGRLRMLTYQLYLGDIREGLNNFDSSSAEFEKSLDLLRTGNLERPISVPWNKMTYTQFLRIEDNFLHIKDVWSQKKYPLQRYTEKKKFIADIDDFVRMIEKETASWIMVLQYLQFAMLTITTLISLFIIHFTKTFILAPVKKLHTAFNTVKNGKLNTEVSIETKDEFGDLGTDFNDMTSSLNNLHSELNMQNRKLKETWKELKETRDRYATLYEHAPVGYFTMDKAGCLLDINQTGAAMLQKERAFVVGQSFLTYVVDSDAPLFLQHLQDIPSAPDKILTELRIKATDNQVYFIRLESSTESNVNLIRTVMTDISQLKNNARRIDELLRENRQLTQSMFKVQEEERRHIVRELHDELGQWLTGISVEAKLIANDVSGDSRINTCAQIISNSVDKMHAVIHDLLYQLRPPMMDTFGLTESLRELGKEWCSHRSGISFELVLEGSLENLSETINITVYRIIQESLNNISKYAHASQVKVRLSRGHDENSTDTLLLSVEDNGRGFKLDQRTYGIGVLGMRERVIAAGGEFVMHSAPSHGTRIDVRFLHAGSVRNC